MGMERPPFSAKIRVQEVEMQVTYPEIAPSSIRSGALASELFTVVNGTPAPLSSKISPSLVGQATKVLDVDLAFKEVCYTPE